MQTAAAVSTAAKVAVPISSGIEGGSEGGSIGTVETEIAPEIGVIGKIEEVAPKAIQTAGKLEQDLKAGVPAENVLEDFTNPRDQIDRSAGNVTAETKTTDEKPLTKAEEAANSQAVLNEQIETKMLDWDDNHPIPSDKKGYNKYVQERAAAEKDFTVSARVDNDMQGWLKDNPAPDKSDSKAYSEWQQKVDAQKQKLTKDHTRNYDREIKLEKKEHDGMSAAEFAKKVEQLKTYRANEARMIQAIAKNVAIKNRTPEIETQRQLLEDLRNQHSAQADALQSILEADAAASRSPWKKMMLPMLLVGVMMAGPALQAAEQDSK